MEKKSSICPLKKTLTRFTEYGMMVMAILRDEFKYSDLNGWYTLNPNALEEIKYYNESKKRFNFYAQGIFCTAYARRNVWTGILEFGKEIDGKSDYIYSDTDSVKVLNYERHMDYINKYNQMAINNLKKMCEHYDIDFNLCCPKTIKGKEKMLGVWELEGNPYEYFKTLGAKRYMVVKDGELSFTISGVSKKSGVPYLLEKFNGDIEQIFNYFNDNFKIPKDYTGKLTHTYIDDGFECDIVDYNNVKCRIKELSFIHLEKCEFNLTISDRFIRFLKLLSIKEVK